MSEILQNMHRYKSILIIGLVLVTLTLKENFNSMALILFLAYGLYSGFRHKINFRKNIISYIPFLVFLGVCSLSLFFSDSFKGAEKYFLKSLPFFIIPLGFSLLKIGKKEYRIILKIFVCWMLLNAIYSHFTIFQQLLADGEPFRNLFRKDYSYLALANTIGMHPTYYSFYILIGITILLNEIVHEIPSRWNILYGFLILYFSFFLVHLSTRTSIVALFLLLMGFILRFFWIRKRLVRGIIVMILLSALIMVTLYNVRATRYRFQQIIGLTFSNGTRHDDGLNKLKQFEAAFNANTNLLIGNGIANANKDIHKSYQEMGLESFAQRKYNAHNQYLQAYVGLGIIGVIALVSILLFYMKFFKKHNKPLGFVFVLACSLLFMTESYLERHNGIVMFVFLIALSVNYDKTFSFFVFKENGNTNMIKNQRK